MPLTHNAPRLPDYQAISDIIQVLDLSLSSSALHGLICAYLCAGAIQEGESYIRSFIVNAKDAEMRKAVLTLFDLFTISYQQINNLDFAFELLLPGDHALLAERARAFSEWCEAFTEGLMRIEVDKDCLNDEEAQETLQHLEEFAQMDYHALKVEEEDEKALMEVSEYARLAVLRLHTELHSKDKDKASH